MNFKNLTGFDKNEDMILLNTVYHNSRKLEDGTYSNDAISLIFKDIKTNKKHLRTIENPEIEVFIAKDDVEINHPLIHVPIECVKRHDVNYKNITKDLCKLLGEEYMNYYWNCIKQKRFRELKNVHKCERVFSSDVNIEDFYRYKALSHFGKKNKYNITKGYLDIEADLMKGKIDLKESTGDAPINAVTLIDSDKKKIYTFLLRNPDNPQIDEFEKNIENFKQELHQEFDDRFGDFDYNIMMYDDELQLIKDLFIVINTIKLDFILIWNMSFDIRYIIDRIIKLGGNPSEIICHPDFLFNECAYYKDKRNYKISLKTDYFNCSGYTIFSDQMINYGSVRKSGPEIESFKLDFIGEKEVGVKKLDYSDTGSIRTLAYKNYAMFVKYNIQDTLVQYKIEEKTTDIETIFRKAYDSATRYSKANKETVFLRNIAFIVFKDQGYILGNNQNVDYAKPFGQDDSEEDDEKKEKFEGAVVGDPLLNLPFGIKLHGNKKSMFVFNYVNDFDYTSLYPSITRIFNIYPSTQIGRFILNKISNDREIIIDEKRYDRGGKFIDDLELNQPILFGYRWLNLPSAENMINKFGDKLGDKKYKNIVKKYKNIVKVV